MIEVTVDGAEAAGASAAEVTRVVRAVLDALDVERAFVSVTFLGDAAVAELHREHLGHDGPTDVISFRLYEEGEPVVGDVYVGFEQARRQADELGVGLEEELARLVVHGTLHVLGYEHPDAPEERSGSDMYALQEELVRQLTGGEGEGGP